MEVKPPERLSKFGRRAALGFACLGLAVFFAAAQQPDPSPPRSIRRKTYPVETLKADLKVLWDVLEEGHGGFDRYTSVEAHKKSFEAVEKGLAGPLTEFEFYVRLLPLIAGIKDGHTLLVLSTAATLHLDGRPVFFPFGLRFLKDKAYIFRNLSADTSFKDGSGAPGHRRDAHRGHRRGAPPSRPERRRDPHGPAPAPREPDHLRPLSGPAVSGSGNPAASGSGRSKAGRPKEITVPGITASDIVRLLRETVSRDGRAPPDLRARLPGRDGRSDGPAVRRRSGQGAGPAIRSS